MQVGFTIILSVNTAAVTIRPIMGFWQWEKLIKTLPAVDDMLEVQDTTTKRVAVWGLLFYSMTLAVYIISTIAIFISFLQFKIYKYYIFMPLYQCYFYYNLYLMMYINNVITTQLKIINKRLRETAKWTNAIYCLAEIQTMEINPSAIKKFMRAYKATIETLKMYNEIFGFRMFLMLVYTFLALLDKLALSVLIPLFGTPVFNKIVRTVLRIQSVTSVILNTVSSQKCSHKIKKFPC